MLKDDTPPHPSALNWSNVEPTGRIRWRLGRLQQEWGQDWSNEAGTCTEREWRDVPFCDGFYTEGAPANITVPVEPTCAMVDAAADYYYAKAGHDFSWHELIKTVIAAHAKEYSNGR